MSDNETLSLLLSAIRETNSRLDKIIGQVESVRDKIISIEAKELPDMIEALKKQFANVDNRLTIMETKAKVTVAMIATITSVLTSVITGVILWLVKGS